MTDTTATAARFTGRTAWARNLEAPLRNFLRTETGSAAILLGATLAALAWVNIDQSSYERVWNTVLSITIGFILGAVCGAAAFATAGLPGIPLAVLLVGALTLWAIRRERMV